MLRIIATLFILILHANFNCLGKPTQQELIASPINTFLRAFLEYSTEVGVNVFILISGWFGMKSSIKSAIKLLFQSAFFLMIGVIFYTSNGYKIGIETIINVLTSYKLWFIPAYLGLYLLSPVLNAFIKNANNKQFLSIIICFYLFQTFYGYFTPFLDTIGRGYSTFSFIGLYLLAAFSRKNCERIKRNYYCFTYFSMVLINATIFMLALYFIPSLSWIVDGYINPLTIIASLSLMLWFSSLKIPHIKSINWISKSAFGVFLLHSAFYEYYKSWIVNINESYSGLISMIYIAAIILSFSCAGILFDKIRIAIWNRIAPLINLQSLALHHRTSNDFFIK